MTRTFPTIILLAGEARVIYFDFRRYPEVVAGATLSAPSVPAVTGLSFGTPTVTSVDVVDDEGQTIPAGQAVQVLCTVSALGSYTVNCDVSAGGGVTLGLRGTIRVS